jgi:predicted DNA-binding transcriptional regulator AlpA
MRVISMREGAERSDQSVRTLQRQIAEGKGPPVVEISERRRGFLEADFEEWLLGRRRPALEPPAPKRGRGRPRKNTSGEAA